MATVAQPNPNLMISTTGNKPKPISNPSLIKLSFNQDCSWFAARTRSGFLLFNSDPFRRFLYRDDIDGCDSGVGAVEMLEQSNLFALVGGGDSPQFPSKVMIWDDYQVQRIGEIYFRFQVLGVRLRQDRIIVVLLNKITVHNFDNLKFLYEVATIDNPKGLCAVSQGTDESYALVCPGQEKGEVRVEYYEPSKKRRTVFHINKACDLEIASLTLSQDGKLLATAGSKGTLVRIYDTRDGTFLQEVCGGANMGEIYSMAFSPKAQWLAVSSDNRTVHAVMFKDNCGNVGTEKSSSPPKSSAVAPSSSLSFTKGEEYIVGFGPQENIVVILGLDGSYYRCEFDLEVTGGEMTILEHQNFLKPSSPV